MASNSKRSIPYFSNSLPKYYFRRYSVPRCYRHYTFLHTLLDRVEHPSIDWNSWGHTIRNTRANKNTKGDANACKRISLHFYHSKNRDWYHFSLFLCVTLFVWFPLMSAEAQLSDDNSITVSTEDERMEYLTSSDSPDTLSVPSDSAACMNFTILGNE